MSKVHTLSHPLVGTYLDALRDKESNSETFRMQTTRLGRMLALELTKDLATKEKYCDTPMQGTTQQVTYESIGIVPILRAGIGMVDPFLDFLPDARVLYIGMYRDEQTHLPVPYYNKLEDTEMVDVAYVIDPMLATGGSARAAVFALKEWGVKQIKFAGLIGSPEGVVALQKEFPEVDIYLAALDEKLDENAYIIPGLGDAGDRIFNT